MKDGSRQSEFGCRNRTFTPTADCRIPNYTLRAAPGNTAPPEPQADTEVESVIGNDFTIEGQSITIRCQGALRINGNIQADLHSRRLVVGEAANIYGAITAESIQVSGHVQGAIHGSRVLLRSGATVEGDIFAQLLTIEEGASFDGRSRRVNDPSEVAPQLGPAPSAEPSQPYAAPVALIAARALGMFKKFASPTWLTSMPSSVWVLTLRR